jgi:predicted HicB family RNase H-like nuclease
MSALLELPAAPAHTQVPPAARAATALRVAAELEEQQPDWVTFFREVLGVDGLVRRLFPTEAELAAFERTTAYAEIQWLLNRLRDQARVSDGKLEPTRVITVRLPKSLHESLRAEAHDCDTSMNQLCIRKLLAAIDAGDL